jgi:electron transport complex protein RnfD
MTMLTISQSPHLKAPFTTQKIMLAVIMALLPAILVQIWFYGFNFVLVLIQAVLASVLTEWLIQQFLLKEKSSIHDASAALTGVLLALNVPATIHPFPLWAGSVIAVGLGKMAFGGIGRNPFNPALVGRAFMLASFPIAMTQWPKPFFYTQLNPDVITQATPLSLLKEGAPLLSWSDKFFQNGFAPGLWSFEILALAYLIGGAFLILIRVITPVIPLSYLLGLTLLTLPTWLLGGGGSQDPLFHLIMGGTMLGAFFMATDYSTSPMIPKTQFFYGLLGGILCAIIRLWGAYPDGVAYSILIMNAAVPLMNKYIQPKRFGSKP